MKVRVKRRNTDDLSKSSRWSTAEEESPVAGLMHSAHTKPRTVPLKRKSTNILKAFDVSALEKHPTKESPAPQGLLASSSDALLSSAASDALLSSAKVNEHANGHREHPESRSRQWLNVRVNGGDVADSPVTPMQRSPASEQSALMKLTSSKEAMADQMRRSIMKFIEVRAEPRSLHFALTSAQSVILQAMENTDARDELFMQILRQTRSNGGVSALRAWELLQLVACTMPPSKEYKGLVTEYVDAVCRLDVIRPHIRKVARKVQAALASSMVTGPRKQLPSIEELEAQVLGRKLTVPVFLVDGTRVHLPFEIATTVASCIPHIGHLIGLNNYGSFSLFKASKVVAYDNRMSGPSAEEHAPIERDIYLADVLHEMKGSSRAEGLCRGLLFKKQIFGADDADIQEARFHELCYLQVQHDFLRGRYLVTPDEAIWLCALQVHASSGFSSRFITISGALETAVQDFSHPEHFLQESHWIERVWDRYNRLNGLSKHEAWRQFLGILGSKPYGKAVFFPVTTATDPLGILTPTATVAVNRRGIHFFKEEPYSLVLSATLAEVMHYGSNPRAIFFKIKLDDRLHVFRFKTPHGEIICTTLQQHINHAFMRRFKARAAFMASAASRAVRQEPEEEEIVPVKQKSLPLAGQQAMPQSHKPMQRLPEITAAGETEKAEVNRCHANGKWHHKESDKPELVSADSEDFKQMMAERQQAIITAFNLPERGSEGLARALVETMTSSRDDFFGNSSMGTSQTFFSLDVGQNNVQQAYMAALLEAKGESITNAEIEIALLKDALSAAVAERDAALISLTRIKDTVETRPSEAAEIKEASLQTALEQVVELKKLNEKLEEKLHKAMAEKGVDFKLFNAVEEQLVAALEKNHEGTCEIRALQERVQQVRAQEQEALAELQNVQLQLGGQQTAASGATEMLQRLDSLSQECEALRSELTAAQTGTVTDDHADAAEKCNKAAQLQVEGLTMECKQLKEGLELAEERAANLLEQARIAEGSSAEWQQQVDQFMAECQKLQQDLDRARAELKSLQEYIATAQSSTAEFQQQIAGLKADSEGLQHQLKLCQEQSASLQTQVESAQSLAAERQQQLDSLTEECDYMAQELKLARDETASLKEQTRVVHTNVSDHSEQLESLTIQCETVKQQLRLAQAETAELRQKAKTAQGMDQKADSLKMECQKLKQDLRLAQQEADLAVRAREAGDDEAECKIRSLEQQCQQLKEALEIQTAERKAGKQDSHVDTDSQISSLKEVCEELREELDSGQEEAFSAKTAHTALQEEFAKIRAQRDGLQERVTQLDQEAAAMVPLTMPDSNIKALSAVESSLVFELWRTVEENTMLRQRISEYEKDVEKLVNSSNQLGHQNAKQKLQYHLSWKKDLEALKQECTVLLRERFQLEQCIRYLAVRCGLAVTTTDVTATQWRDAVAKLQPASLAANSVLRYSGHSTRLPDMKLTPPNPRGGSQEQEPSGNNSASEASLPSASSATSSSVKVESAVEQNILQRVAFVCLPPGSKNEGELRMSGPDSRIVTTVRPKGRSSEQDSSSTGKGARSVTKIPRVPHRQP